MSALNDVCDPEFWNGVCPSLNITAEESDFSGISGSPVLTELDEDWENNLVREGYLNIPGAFSVDRIRSLKSAVDAMVKNNFPPVLATVYDEYWELFHQFEILCRPALGDELFLPPSVWIWYLDPDKEDSGFAPHRDRPDLQHEITDLPRSLTVWAPLTDATPLNGCMYIVPANLDEGYLTQNDDARVTLQNVRALPASAGSVLFWNQRLLHWGGKTAQRAREPRISVAIELQCGDIPSTAKPLLQMKRRPSLRMRLKIIGRSALFYRSRYAYPPNAIELFSKLSSLDAPDAPADWDAE